jgi:hypothetical protein
VLRLDSAGKEGLRASGSCAAEWEAREDARMPRGCFTGGGECQMAGDGVAASFTAEARVRRWRGVGLVRVRKRECARLDHAFIG